MKKFTIMHYTLLSLSLGCSVIFYKEMSVSITILAIVFELFKPIMFVNAVHSKGTKRLLFSTIVIILLAFNLLAISSNFLNNYNKMSIKKIKNEDYNNHISKLKELKISLDNTQNELIDYPALKDILSQSPAWEDKEGITNNWTNNKKDITTRLDKATDLYNKELSLKVSKYTIVKSYAGYEALGTASKLTGIKTKDLLLMIYVLFAIMLEMLIFYSKTLSVKEFKSYKKTNEELEIELFNDFKNKLFNEQMNLLEANLRNINTNKIEIVEIENKKPDPEPPKPKKLLKEITEEIEEEQEKYVDGFTVDEILNGTEIPVEQVMQDNEELEEPTINKFEEKTIKLKNYELFKRYMLKSLDENNVSIGYKKIIDKINNDYDDYMNYSEGLKIFNLFKIKNLIETRDRKTFVDKERLSKIDILEVLKDERHD